MMKKALVIPALFAGALTAGVAMSSDQQLAQQPVKTQAQEQIYGSQMMTRQERTEFRSKMRAAKTAEEREHIRMEHHERMKKRAKERGVTLPDEPPARGGGMMGPGSGMGPGGGGMGAGGSRR